MALLQEYGLPERGWIFPTTSGKPGSGLSPVVRKIWGDLEIPRFTAHDLRRTAATGMTSMGIDRLTVSRLLNHSEGGITRVYDRFSYDTPKKNALEAWGAKLLEIVADKPAGENVVTLAVESHEVIHIPA